MRLLNSMPNLNKVILMGNLTRDIEMRVLPKGTAVGQFAMAINRKFKTESGEQREEVLFVDCEAWGKTAETLAKYVGKGAPLYVEGRLRLDQWEDKTTKEKKSRMKVVVEQFQFLGSKEGAVQAPAQSAAKAPGAQQDLDSDVAF